MMIRWTTRMVTGVLLLFCILCLAPALADTSSDYWNPWVTKTNTTSATINWWQKTADGNWTVKYANASYYDAHGDFDHSVSDPESASFHHVLITGLDPNTTYKYLVEDKDKKDLFSVRRFQTFPVSGPFTFIVISDTHANEKRFRYVADALQNEQDVLFILHGGDYSEWDDTSMWKDFFDYSDGMLANYTLYTTIGNHEYHNSSGGDSLLPTTAYEYRNSFDLPLNYSFDCAGIRFVVLDSPDPKNANGDDPLPSKNLSKSQASWLKDQLNNNLSGTFVIDHHPVWSYGRTSMDTAFKSWETLFHEYPISADFSGHLHCYQRLSVEGIPYFDVGNAGGKFDNMTPDEPYPQWYVWGKTYYLGYLKVTVDPENNSAVANEFFAACVTEWDAETAATVFNPPVLADSITFPLKTNRTGNSGSDDSDTVDPGRGTSYVATSPGGPAGSTLAFTFNQALTANDPGAFVGVAVIPSTALGETELTLTDADSIDTTPLAGRQIAYIASLELVGVNPSAVSSGTITFAVSGTWLSDHGLSSSDIVLMRYHDGAWTELPTTYAYTSGGVYYFVATTPGLSYFAIATRDSAVPVNTIATVSSFAEAAVTAEDTREAPTTPVTPAAAETTAAQVSSAVTTATTPAPSAAGVHNGMLGGFMFTAAGLICAGVILIAAGIWYIRRWWIRRQNPALFRKYD